MTVPVLLLRLVCPQQCTLGAVTHHEGRDQIAVQERSKVMTADGETWHTAMSAPHDLDEQVSYGCRHLSGALDAEQRRIIARKLDQVRRGDRRAGDTHVLRRSSGIVA